MAGTLVKYEHQSVLVLWILLLGDLHCVFHILHISLTVPITSLFSTVLKYTCNLRHASGAASSSGRQPTKNSFSFEGVVCAHKSLRVKKMLPYLKNEALFCKSANC